VIKRECERGREGRKARLSEKMGEQERVCHLHPVCSKGLLVSYIVKRVEQIFPITFVSFK